MKTNDSKSVICKGWCTQIYTIRPECIIRAVVSAPTLFIIYIYVLISLSVICNLSCLVFFYYPALLALTLVTFSVPMFRQLNGSKNLLILSDKFVQNDKLK